MGPKYGFPTKTRRYNGCSFSLLFLHRSVDIRPPSLLLSGMIPFPRRERLSLPFFLLFFFEFLVVEREQGSQMDGT